ncbi:MAG: carboxylesterase/lipase family protein [Bacteroidales bacterium]|nr:carboxylesterase/lipase family protein [Bacteroidales bacterium]
MKHSFFLLFVPALMLASCCGGQQAQDGQRLFVGDDIAITQTQYGQVQGYILDDVYTYLGIPYGASTAGENRFMPPQEPASWEGIRPAMFYGNDAPQGHENKWKNNSSTFTDHWNYYDYSEDCLNLNVWTPAPDGKKRPVLVWMHGGGFAAGNSIEQDGYHGANLTRSGDIVFVSVNHRLNVFGFSDLSSAGPAFAHSGNVGVLDLVAALKWVHNNIENFGGDPGNVTIMGQSGGGAKVCDVLAMPCSEGLVHKVVGLSGNAITAADPVASKALGAAILKKVGGNVKKLQEMPWEEYYALANGVAAEIGAGGMMGGFAPIADGEILPKEFFADKNAASAQVPLMLCTTTSEFALSKENPTLEAISFDDAVKMVSESFGQPKAKEALEALQKAFPKKKPIELINMMVAQRTSVLATADAKYAQGGAPVYLAWFDYNAPLWGGRIRAFHCADICYWFKNTDLMVTHTGGGAEPRGVSDQMSEALLAFMRTGNPNCKAIPEWPAYNPEEAATMVFDVKSQVLNAPDREFLSLVEPFNPFRMMMRPAAKK